MRILVPIDVFPTRQHSATGAVTVVQFEMFREMARCEDIQLTLLPVAINRSLVYGSSEREAQEELERMGVRYLEAVEFKLPARKSVPLQWIIDGRMERFFPESSLCVAAAKLAESSQPDCLLTVWSECLTTVFSSAPHKKLCYYGNPPPKNAAARFGLDRRERGGRFRLWKDDLAVRRLEHAHLKSIFNWDALANVAANDAEYYRAKGHPNAFYLQNMWIDRYIDTNVLDWAPSVKKITAGLGKTSATASSYGLAYLGNSVLPELVSLLGPDAFELHIYGPGNPLPHVAKALAAPQVKMRGFVPDIDGEILSSPIFLCVNNTEHYNVGHTRFLHAWSLKRCVIAQARVREAMPELVHEKNCLLGGSAAEIAQQVARALYEPDLAETLGEAGYKTFRECFVAEKVVPKLVEAIRRQVT